MVSNERGIPVAATNAFLPRISGELQKALELFVRGSYQDMCSGSEAGSYLRLIDSCITQLTVQRPSRTCNESKEEDTLRFRVAAGRSVVAVSRYFWRYNPVCKVTPVILHGDLGHPTRVGSPEYTSQHSGGCPGWGQAPCEIKLRSRSLTSAGRAAHPPMTFLGP